MGRGIAAVEVVDARPPMTPRVSRTEQRTGSAVALAYRVQVCSE